MVIKNSSFWNLKVDFWSPCNLNTQFVLRMLLVKRSATLLSEAKLLVPELLLAMVTLFIFYFITVNLFLSYKAILYSYFTGKLKFFCKFSSFHHRCCIETEICPFVVQAVALLTLIVLICWGLTAAILIF